MTPAEKGPRPPLCRAVRRRHRRRRLRRASSVPRDHRSAADRAGRRPGRAPARPGPQPRSRRCASAPPASSMKQRDRCPARIRRTRGGRRRPSSRVVRTAPRIGDRAPVASAALRHRRAGRAHTPDDAVHMIVSIRSSATFDQCFDALGHDDQVVDAAGDELLHDPQQVVRRDAEHRRAQAAELIQRQHGPVGRDLVRQAVHEMHLGADRPHRSRRALAHRLQDVLGRAASSAACTTSHGTSGCTMTSAPDAACARSRSGGPRSACGRSSGPSTAACAPS